MNELPVEYGYGNGYIHLANFKINNLPPTLELNDVTLTLKSELHITLICAKKIASLIDESKADEVEQVILSTFINFVEKTPLTEYRPTKAFRFVERDEKKTVVVMVEIPGLNEFFDLLKDKYAKDLPLQPTHVTLYTLQPEIGIGILSQEELERESKPVEVRELDSLSFLRVRPK